MSRLLTISLATAAALGVAAPALAQATTDAMPSTNLPWCSSAVTDHCRQHEGSGSMMHHRSMMHKHSHKHHRMMKHHG